MLPACSLDEPHSVRNVAPICYTSRHSQPLTSQPLRSAGAAAAARARIAGLCMAHLLSRGTAGNLLNFGHVVILEDGSLVLNLRDVQGKSIYKLELPKP